MKIKSYILKLDNTLIKKVSNTCGKDEYILQIVNKKFSKNLKNASVKIK